jgi:hypothetical protein
MPFLNTVDVVESLYERAPGVPEATLCRAYIDAARRFLTSVQWRGLEVTSWVTPTNFAVYTPAALYQDTELVDVPDVTYDGLRLHHSTRSQAISAGFAPTQTGGPYYYEVGVSSIILTPAPTSDVSSALYARVLVRPILGATTILDSLVKDFFEPFEYGALQRIHAIPGPLFDLQTSMFYGVQFQDKLDWWSARAVDGGSGTIRTTRYYAPGRRLN